MCTETSRDVSEGMSNLWGAYAGNIVTNHKTAFFMSTNHRSRKVPRGEREGEREGEISDIKKAPLLRRAALKSARKQHSSDSFLNLILSF